MSNITFKITEERLDELTWEDFEAIENPSNVSVKKVRGLIAPFMVDEQGAYLDANQANAQLLKLKRPEMSETVKQFGACLREALVPKANGN